jgi:hypothetical protein
MHAILAATSEIDPKAVIDLFLSPLAVMASITTFFTGFNAALAVALREDRDELQYAVNVGIARGFFAAIVPAGFAFFAALDALPGS